MKKFNQNILLIAIVLNVAIITITVGFSYAYMLNSSVGNNNISVSTGLFGSNVTFSYTSSNLTVMDDTTGLAQNSYSVVQIDGTNNEYTTYYELGIGYDTTNMPVGTTVENLLPLEYVRVAVYSMNGNNISSSPVVGPIAITDVPMLSIDTSNFLNDLYRLHWGFANSGSTMKFALKFWLDPETPTTYDGKLAYLNVEVKEQAKQTINLFDLPPVIKCDGQSGTIYEFTGIGYLDGRQIDFSNNIQVESAFSNIPEGAHSLMVCDRKTSFLLQNDLETESYARTNSPGITNSYMQTAAYTYGTTVSQILKLNAGKSSNDYHASFTMAYDYLIKQYPPLANESHQVNKTNFYIMSDIPDRVKLQ